MHNLNSLSGGEASLSVRVIKADGSEYHLSGDQIQVATDFEDLVRQYQSAVKTALELEEKIAKYLTGE